MSVQAEFHCTLCRKYRALRISVRQPITEVKAEWNVAADVWEIEQKVVSIFILFLSNSPPLKGKKDD